MAKKKTPVEAADQVANASDVEVDELVGIPQEDIDDLKEKVHNLVVDDDFEVLVPEEPIKNTDITTYAHHGAMVQVKRDLKGKHRQHSLCYQCEFFKPDTLNNCHIAQAVYDNCVKFHITTPLWECPSFKIGETK